jgi:hypothetical protein
MGIDQKSIVRLPDPVRRYLAEIGRVGGSRSRRKLTKEQSREMLRVREARRAFKKFKALCFWSFDSNLKITTNDISWVVEMLMKNGNRESWEVAKKLCR